MRKFWDYRAKSNRKAKAAVSRLASGLGDPIGRLAEFRDSIRAARYSASVYMKKYI